MPGANRNSEHHPNRVTTPLLLTLVLAVALTVAVVPIPGSSAATVLPRLVVPDVSQDGATTTIISVQNVGSEVAFIRADFNGVTGNNFAQKAHSTVMPNEAVLFDVQADFGLPPTPGNYGSVRLYSDMPIAATAWKEQVAADNLEDAMLSALPLYGTDTASPATNPVTGMTVSLPYVSNALEGQYYTAIIIANAGFERACVTLTYSFVPGAGSVGAGGKAAVTDSSATGGCTTGKGVPAKGQLTVLPGFGATVAGFLGMPAATANTLMAVTVTSVGAPIATVVRAWQVGVHKLGIYEGLAVSSTGGGGPTPDVGTTVVVPLALKTQDGYYTQILLSNPNPQATTATIKYTGSSGPHIVTLPLAANGVANHSVYTDSAVPLGFIGGAEVTASVPLAVVVFRAKMTSAGSFIDEQIYTALNGIALGRASTKVAVPFVSRRMQRIAGYEGINSWVSVIVPGGGAATLQIARAGHGCQGASAFNATTLLTGTVTVAITGSRVFYQNADADNGFGAANLSCFLGGFVISSNVPIVVVSSRINDLLPGEREGATGGVPIGP